MTDELLEFYESELAFFRRTSAEFARRNARIARRLQLDENESRDPHVERMIEAFAYLNARIRRKLDDDFPELAESILNVLYPHYLRPTPSMSIVQFAPDPKKGGLTEKDRVNPETLLESPSNGGVRCQFNTCYAVDLWPFELTAAELLSRPFRAPETTRSVNADGLLHLQLTTFDDTASITASNIDRLRFCINLPVKLGTELYELMFNGLVDVVVSDKADGKALIADSAFQLHPVGFEDDQAVLPWKSRSFPGYRLLSEYFAFPEKFLFFDLTGLERLGDQDLGSSLHIWIYLKQSSPDLEMEVSTTTLRLGCTPVINLFRQRADPFVLNHEQYRERIVPDAHNQEALEIYSVENVATTSASGEHEQWSPFYSARHETEQQQIKRYWYATAESRAADPNATDTWLTFVDLSFSPANCSDSTAHVETTCFNGDLPQFLPFGGHSTLLNIIDGVNDVEAELLLRPTPTQRRERGMTNVWRLVSQLSLNHLSIGATDDAVDSLREILRLYDVVDSDATRGRIAAISEISCEPGVARVGGPGSGFARGLEISIVFDSDKLPDSECYFFASVLDRFLGMYASVNSFTRLTATTKKKRNREEPWKWPARAGKKPLL